MKIGIYLNQPVWRVGDRYSANYLNLLPFFTSLGEHVEQCTLCLPTLSDAVEPARYTLDLRATRILPLPFYLGEMQVLKRSPALIVAAIRIALRYFEEWDVIGCTSPSLVGSVWTMMAHRAGKPLFHLVRGNKPETLRQIYPSGIGRLFFGSAVRTMDALTKWSLRNGAMAFVVGADLQRLYREELGPHEVRNFAPILAREFENPDRFIRCASDDEPELLYVGRLSREKGIPDLLHALNQLRTTARLRIRLRIVGDGPVLQGLRALVHELGLEDAVTFEGFVELGPQLLAMYQRASAFVLPSYTEGVPASIAEAMALGVPVVCTAVGGISSVVEDGVSGLLVQPGDRKALARALARVVQEPELAATLAKNGRLRSADFTESAQRAILLMGLEKFLLDDRKGA